MKIIEKIKIEYFRSFADNTIEIVDLTDINIFSGSNDSWKSNILRAINLFFNGNKSWYDFDFYRDFSYQQIEKEKELSVLSKEKWYKWQKSIHKHIDIEIFLNDSLSSSSRPQKISVTRRFNEKWYDKSIYTIPNIHWAVKTKKDENNKNVFENIYFEDYLEKSWLTDDKILKIFNKNWDVKLDEINTKLKEYKEFKKAKVLKSIKSRKISLHSDRYYWGYEQSHNTKLAIEKFLRRFRFEYVPAIKDKEYFSDLFSRTLSLIKDIEKTNKSENINDSLDALSTAFNSWEISKSLDKTHLIWTKFSIPEKLVDFFSTFKILTKEEWNKSEVYLDLRWDWIQVQYIPILLNFISIQERKKPGITPIFIWWFEEPENSYEYKNIRKIINNFVGINNEDEKELINYSKDNQIFITTHSKEILSVENNWKRKEKISIYRIWRNENTGFSSFVSRYNEQYGIFDEELADDLGIINESRLIIELEDKLKNEKDIVENSSLTIKEKEKARKSISKKYEEVLDKLNFAEEEIEKLSKVEIWCEWWDCDIYNNINNTKIKFKSNEEFNKFQIYIINREKDEDANFFWLMDRDFVIDEEKKYIEKNSNIFLLDYYSLENYLYHPNNLEEYYLNIWKGFDIEKYKENILDKIKFSIDEWKLTDTNISTSRWRNSWIIDFFKKKWMKNYNVIAKMFSSIENSSLSFEERYKFFNMKVYWADLAEINIWLKKQDRMIALSKTKWFKEQVEVILSELFK